MMAKGSLAGGATILEMPHLKTKERKSEWHEARVFATVQNKHLVLIVAAAGPISCLTVTAIGTPLRCGNVAVGPVGSGRRAPSGGAPRVAALVMEISTAQGAQCGAMARFMQTDIAKQ